MKGPALKLQTHPFHFIHVRISKFSHLSFRRREFASRRVHMLYYIKRGRYTVSNKFILHLHRRANSPCFAQNMIESDVQVMEYGSLDVQGTLDYAGMEILPPPAPTTADSSHVNDFAGEEGRNALRLRYLNPFTSPILLLQSTLNLFLYLISSMRLFMLFHFLQWKKEIWLKWNCNIFSFFACSGFPRHGSKPLHFRSYLHPSCFKSILLVKVQSLLS